MTRVGGQTDRRANTQVRWSPERTRLPKTCPKPGDRPVIVFLQGTRTMSCRAALDLGGRFPSFFRAEAGMDQVSPPRYIPGRVYGLCLLRRVGVLITSGT